LIGAGSGAGTGTTDPHGPIPAPREASVRPVSCNPAAERFVRENDTLLPEASGAAVTVYDPGAQSAVQTADAVPDLSVSTEIAVVPFEKTHVAPDGGAEKSTRTPGAGDPPEVFTVTSSGSAKE
jgi:hypothetical protein